LFCSSHHNDFLDDGKGKDIAGLDFAALDKLADEWDAGEPV
jgi:hypothetical protein